MHTDIHRRIVHQQIRSDVRLLVSCIINIVGCWSDCDRIIVVLTGSCFVVISRAIVFLMDCTLVIIDWNDISRNVVSRNVMSSNVVVDVCLGLLHHLLKIFFLKKYRWLSRQQSFLHLRRFLHCSHSSLSYETFYICSVSKFVNKC